MFMAYMADFIRDPEWFSATAKGLGGAESIVAVSFSLALVRGQEKKSV